MTFSLIPADEVFDISDELLCKDKKLHLKPAEFYQSLRWPDFRSFCHFHARYGIPTIELINYLKNIINGRSAIEIGAGAGDLGFHLGIHMTDSKIQQTKEVARKYASMQQPTIDYPKDVEKIEALEAVQRYKPQVVIASWITPYATKYTNFGSSPYGINESKILDLVDTFIIIGNLDTHWDKPIRQIPHETLYFPWLVSRAKNQGNNRIFIWNKK